MVSHKSKNLLIIKLCYLLFLVVGLVLVFTETKQELHLEINSYNSSFFDFFYKYVTHLGDGIMFGVLIILFFLLKDKMMSLTYAVTGILTLLATHFFKKIIFKGTPRPVELIGEAKLHLIEGVKMAHWNSFPSGHTTTAFAIATVLIYSTRNFYLQFLYLVLAILAGFSRVYLSQHFMMDILAGSALGILVGLGGMKIVALINKRNS